MNSKLTCIALEHEIRNLPDWMHKLADHIGAPRVFYHFRSARIDGEVMWVDEPNDYEWIRSHHLRDLAKILGITRVRLAMEMGGI